MSETVAQIVAQLGGLSHQERVAIAHAALLSFEPEDIDAEEAWDNELVRRAEQIHSGDAVGIPTEQVFAEWRARRSIGRPD
jgi:putative addiction module component (TIGR02574 family)